MDKLSSNPWTPGFPIKDLPGTLPPDRVSHDADLRRIPSLARRALGDLNESLLDENALWYDMMALKPSVQTYSGSHQILESWKQLAIHRRPRDFEISGAPRVIRVAQDASWVNVSFSFRISDDSLIGNCSGTMSFVPTPEAGEGWKVWMLSTVLEHYSGHGDPDRPLVAKSHQKNLRTKSTHRDLDYAVIIVGGGQSGLALGGRLQALGIPYVILERSALAGYRWTSRYDTVRQHTIREVNNLPFGHTWHASDPEFLPGHTVAQGFSDWIKKYNINVWTRTEVTACRFDNSRARWTVDVTSDGQRLTLRSVHLSLALGAGLTSPRQPTYPNEHLFAGTLMHMVSFKNSSKWRGQRGLVVGSGTAAHDIAQDMLDHGLSSVAMLQRNKTAVYPIDWYAGAQRGMYRHDREIERPDRIVMAAPIKIATEIQRRSYDQWMKAHPQYFDEIEKVGFRLDRESTPNEVVLNHFGGYYIDIGTTKHIVNGDIKIKSGVTVDHFTPNSKEIGLSDGSIVEADFVVLATGYEPDYRKDIAPLLGEEVSGTLDPFWGLDENGDIRGYMKEQKGEGVPPGLWLLAGAASHARFYSRFMALAMQRGLLKGDTRILGGKGHANL